MPKSMATEWDRQKQVNFQLVEADKRQEAERAEDRAFLQKQTEYGRQSRNLARWSIGLTAIAAIASVTTVVLMLAIG